MMHFKNATQFHKLNAEMQIHYFSNLRKGAKFSTYSLNLLGHFLVYEGDKDFLV